MGGSGVETASNVEHIGQVQPQPSNIAYCYPKYTQPHPRTWTSQVSGRRWIEADSRTKNKQRRLNTNSKGSDLGIHAQAFPAGRAESDEAIPTQSWRAPQLSPSNSHGQVRQQTISIPLEARLNSFLYPSIRTSSLEEHADITARIKRRCEFLGLPIKEK